MGAVHPFPTVAPDDRIAVWFSCGAASAAALKLTVDRYGRERVRAVNTPVAEEPTDNRRFLADVSAWVGLPIEEAVNPDWPDSSAATVWARERFMAGPYGASCTRALKKGARYAWERGNRVEWHVLGFTSEERHRHERFTLTERPNVLPMLIEARMTKKACLQLVLSAGLVLPASYREGFPNANCIGCVKVTSPTYWNHVRALHPEVFAARAQQSRDLNVRLVEVRKERVFLDELSPSAKGRRMPDNMPDCGLFCEEPQAPTKRAAA